MAMNLRLPSELAEALRALAEETGRSQQELARDAIAEYTATYPLRSYPPHIRRLIVPAQRRTSQAEEARRRIASNYSSQELEQALAEMRSDSR